MITKERIGYVSETEVISAWFAAKLIPDYVDTVTVENNAVVFVKNGETIATFNPTATSPLTVNINATNTLSTKHSISTNTTTALYGFSCKSAVAVRYIHGESTSYPFAGGFAFVKDNTGETVIVTSQNHDSIKNTELATAYAVRRDTNIGATAPKPYTFTARQSSATVMRPFQIYTHDGAIVYTPDAFLCETYQHADACKISANGTDYLSFGVWAFRDAETQTGGGASAEELEEIREEIRGVESELRESVADFGAQAQVHYANKENPHGVTAEQVGAPTGAQFDLLLQTVTELQTASTLTQLNIGDDLDTLQTAGIWYAVSGAVAATIINTPFASAAFRVEVKVITNNRPMQILYPNWDAGFFFVRNLTGSGWSSWYRIRGVNADQTIYGAAIPMGANLNDYTTVGDYYIGSTEIAASLTGTPSDGSTVTAHLEVKGLNNASNTRLIQIYTPNWATSAQLGLYYMRQLISSGWTNWFRYQGTAVTAEPE